MREVLRLASVLTLIAGAAQAQIQPIKPIGAIQPIGAPKPPHIDTFGFQSARHYGVDIVKNLMVDAKTTSRWYFVVAMGRKAGHLALGIGKAVSATCTIIPEEFPGDTISLSDICDVVEGAIIKRRAMGRSYGVVLLSEALVERFNPDEVAELQDVDRDAQGNILEPGDVEEGMRAAEAIGDDMLQKQTQGVVVPESFTHGSSAQRMQALQTGLKTGNPAACKFNR